ncbi:MAG: alpha/beta fold hydrolase [Tannerellaceae bacterium]|nr:alpha/beta fold hydrolase [Tannerellaceae bacterium]MCD8264702.1 alpha/beta fold hydrolase [Tannerellaceae bacterium]
MKSKNLILCFLVILFSACTDEVSNTLKQGETTTEPQTEVLASYSLEDLREIERKLMAAGYDVPFVAEQLATRTSSSSDEADYLIVEVLKVSVKSPNPSYPNYPDEYITISGVLLIPKFILIPPTVKLVVTPPPTIVVNSACPSVLFQDPDSVSADDFGLLYNFWVSQAASGYAVLIPDYPGFGDSSQQAYMPYVVREPMVKATYDLTQAAKLVLSANGYPYHSDISVCGYSQGAFVAASFVHAMETDPTYDETVDVLVLGGIPADLKYLIDAGVRADSLPLPYLYMYVMCGYKANGYDEIVLTDLLQEPYASEAFTILDGVTYPDPNQFLPNKPEELFTENLRLNLDIDPNLAYVNTILEENSVPNWVNQCKMVMLHGTSDVTVFYQNAKNFADRQEEAGGDITFIQVPGGDHTTTAAAYILAIPGYLLLN